jgi:hypothetical protein
MWDHIQTDKLQDTQNQHHSVLLQGSSLRSKRNINGCAGWYITNLLT